MSVWKSKIVLGDNLIISIATEFIENENEDIKKQDCERKAFKRLAKKAEVRLPKVTGKLFTKK
jgi:hypothetical protein